MALTETAGASRERAVLIFDGECPVCAKAVAWVAKRSLPDAFEFLSCHSDELATRFPSIDKSACLRAMHLALPDGTVLAGERALPEIFLRLSRYRFAASILALPGARFLSRAFYRWFAKHRFHISRALFRGGPR